MTKQQTTQAPHPVLPVWGDVDKEAVSAFLIEFRTALEPGGIAHPKLWRRDEVEMHHWERLVEIAETQPPQDADEALRVQSLGFTWVSRVWYAADPETGYELGAPEHIEAMAEAAGLPVHAL